MSSKNSAAVPAIRGFQLDAGAIGKLKKSVNLFRGDVNFHQKLVHLTARPGKKELDIDLSILYQSNIYQQSRKWNRDSATSILGLGWELPLEEIGLNETGALTPATKSYYYSSSGSKNPLVRNLTANPARFSMATSFKPTSGSAIGANIQGQFQSNGIAIDAGAMASDNGKGGWIITDHTNLQLFEIQPGTNILYVFDGGESYQLQNYSFWKILYYPIFERWLIVKESGVQFSFGGYNPSTNKNKNQFNTSQGNSVQWAVAWADGNGKPIWTGSSSLDAAGSQIQYAKNWRMHTITDRWGDQVIYNYNEFGPDGTYKSYSKEWRDKTADLLPVVEQRVGANGLPYTKENYLTSIIDSFGRKLIFNYGDKAYTKFTGGASAAAAREYLDPHRELDQQVVASNASTYPAPNAYQDHYETKFLDSINVQNKDASALFSIGFHYEAVSSSYAGYPNSDRLYGDTIKRQLSGITQYNEYGESMLQSQNPELAFSYCATGTDNPGALETITYPDGGVATYTYTKQDLDICDRKVSITPPSALGASASARVFYGEDYVVSLWTNSFRTQLSMRVYTWLGRWEVWELNDVANGSLLYNNSKGSIVVQSSSRNALNTTIGKDFFVVHFSDGINAQAYAFAKDTAQPGQWLPYQTIGGPETGYNKPSAHWSTNSEVSFKAGGTWFLALERTAAHAYNLFCYTHRWAQNQSGSWHRGVWTGEQVINNSNDNVYLSTTTDCYFTLSIDGSNGTANVNWLDPKLTWQAGGSENITGINLRQSDNAVVTMGQSFAVFTNQTRNPGNFVYYDARIFQWNSEYEFITATWNNGTDSTTTPLHLQDRVGRDGKDATPSFVPHVVGNSLVGIAGNIFRFDGKTWWTRTGNDGLPVDRNASYLHFAYGSDYSVQSWVDNRSPKGNLIAYDPNTTGGSNPWNASDVDVQGLPGHIPSYDGENSNWTTGGNADYMTVGSNVYYRGSSSNWETQVGATGYTIQPAANFQINSAAIGNQAPSFISYFEYNNQGIHAATVGALVLRNGLVDPTLSQEQSFSGERYYTSLEKGSGFGLTPHGPNSVVTYPDSAANFQAAQNIYLRRFAGQGLSGTINHRPVTAISIHDGMEQAHDTAYSYNTQSAACDPSGNVVKYFEANTYPGVKTPTGFTNGFKQQQYINGLIALTISNLPDGAALAWNDGGGNESYKATKANDSHTINNVTNTVLQSLTLNTPSAVNLSFLYGTKEFSKQYNTVNSAVKVFTDLPEAPIGFFQMLDGMLWRIFTYKSEGASTVEIKRLTHTWQPYTEIAGDLVNSGVPNIPLKGGLVLQTGQSSIKDGTHSSETISYIPHSFTAPTSGQEVSKTQVYYDGDGHQITSVESTNYAYEAYASFRYLHMLNLPAQKITRRNNIVSKATADVYANATASTGASVPAKSATFKFASGAFHDFPFSTYNATNPSTWSGWLRNNEILARGPKGVVLTSRDAIGVSHSILYDKAREYSLATSTNAYFPTRAGDTVVAGVRYPNGEAAYTGFESYEDLTGWGMDNGTAIYPSGTNLVGDCHSGEKSLLMPQGASLSKAITPTLGNQEYLVGFWYRTDAGFKANGLTVSVTPAATTYPSNPQFSDSGGKWVFATVGIKIPATPATPAALTIKWQNNGTANVFLDDIFITPLVSELKAHVYDPTFGYITATHDSPGKTSKILRSRFHETLANIGYNNQVRNLTLHYRSRMQNPVFYGLDPNAKLTLSGASGGWYADFRDGGEFAQRFDISNFSQHWKVDGNRLIRTTSEDSDSIQISITDLTLDDAKASSLYLDIGQNGSSPLSAPFSIDIDGYAFTYTPATKTWTGNDLAKIPAVKLLNTPRSILLVSGKGLIALFADGRFIGSLPLKGGNEVITFHTGSNEMVITNLMAILDPRLKLDYADATGKKVQTQTLHGRDALVSQSVHDELGRDAVVTKAMPFSFQNDNAGGGQAQPTLQYRLGLVDLNAFLTALKGNGQLTGDLADFYQGDSPAVKSWQTTVKAWQTDDEVSYSFTPSNDAGYPYTRKHYEPSPLGRVIEKGRPGKLSDGTLLAIDLTQPAANRKTIQYTYGYDSSAFTLPSEFTAGISNYFVVSEIQPLKSRKVQMKDQMGVLISTLKFESGQTIPVQYTQNFDSFAADGKTTHNRYPNYFTHNSNRNSTNFETLIQHDLLGHVAKTVESDVGPTLYIYDDLGRLRFELPNQGTSTDPYIKYTCYDPVGKVVRNGLLDGSKNPWSGLAAHANDPSWPPEGTGTISRTLQYSDAGNDTQGPVASNFRHVSLVETHNFRTIKGAKKDLTVSETFAYHITGKIASVTEKVQELDQSSGRSTTVGDSNGYKVSYAFNNLGEIAQVTYQDPSTYNTEFSYDELGRETETNFAHKGEITVNSAFTGGKKPASRELWYDPQGTDDPNKYEVEYLYEGMNWLKSGKAPDGAHIGLGVGDYTYNANGRKTGLNLQFTRNEERGNTPYTYHLDQAYTYDEALKRLKSSTDSQNSALNVDKLAYDENGNVLSLEQNKSPLHYEFKDNSQADNRSNLLSTISTSSIAIANNDQGQITSSPSSTSATATNTINYDESFGLTASVKVNNQQVTYAYGSQGQLIWRRIDPDQGTTSNQIYVSPGLRALLHLDLEDDSKSIGFAYDTQNTLLGITTGNNAYMPVTNQIGTVVAWMDGYNKVQSAHKFLPFGLVQHSDNYTTAPLPVIFGSHIFDAVSGYYNFKYRMYDPNLRRFTSPDHKRQYPSPFLYVGNNPVSLIDPTGDISKDAIAGFTLSGAAIAFGLLTFQPWVVAIGVTSLTNTISHKNESGGHFWKNYVESEVGTAIGLAEIAGGAALTVVTGGSLGSVGGGTLIGAGVSAVSYSTFHEGDFNWGAYAKAQVIGAVGGFITGGVGAIGGAIAGGAELTGGALLAAQITTGAVAGSASSLAGSAISAAWDHKSINWKSALINAGISGALGGASAGLFNKIKFGTIKPAEGDKLYNPTYLEEFFLGKNETFILPEVEAGWTPNNNQIARLAGPISFNSKKPVISALHDYAKGSENYI